MCHVLGIDVSTQSLTAIVLQVDFKTLTSHIITEESISYSDTPQLLKHGIDVSTKLIPSLTKGEANQPPLMFLESLEIILEKISSYTSKIDAINVSAQQHGHVYLNKTAQDAFQVLHSKELSSLTNIFANSFSYPHAPIWMTSASLPYADELRKYIGGSQKMMELSGSDSPARFTGAIIKYIAHTYPDLFAQTTRIHLLSSFISGILAGREDISIDWGNGSGMSLMDYHQKQWSPTLLMALKDKTPLLDQVETLLPSLSSPLETIDCIAPYFIHKYGFQPHCKVIVGSGDNPQTKVAVPGNLLSLGSSFVIMSSIDTHHKLPLNINAMYDGLGLPFAFGCRTNGALVWDRVRNNASFEYCETLLQNTNIGTKSFIWQPLAESFPLSPIIKRNHPFKIDQDYPAIIDSNLALLHAHAKSFMYQQDHTRPLYVTGGPSNSQALLYRIASFWNCPVIQLGNTGAALGAALAGAVSVHHANTNTPITALINAIHNHIAPQLIKNANPLHANSQDINTAHLFETQVINEFSYHLQ